ncbi:hypothetical protein [Microbispora sp. CA-102843]|uniref:hypothetical protein n=1 Tax=Microbispora sp. CA-102843 TaxID=3239952 RepID=UPI003D8E62B3
MDATSVPGKIKQAADAVAAFTDAHPVGTVVLGVLGLLLLALAFVALRAAVRAVVRGLRTLIALIRAWAADRPSEDILTIVAASIATGVSAQGMWRFFGDVLGFSGPIRVGLFAFIEVAVVTSAVRARRNMRENYSAGIDGLAVWVLTSLSAVLSSMDAGSVAEAVFRLAAPLVAAWLWERGMAIERHRITGRGRIHWRLTPERVLVRLGLAEATSRTAGEVDVQRRLTRVALAAKRARALREAGASDRKLRAAMARLDKAMDAAVEYAALGRDQARQEALREEIAALLSAEQLLDVAPASAWTTPEQPPEEPVEMAKEAQAAIAAYEEWRRPKLMPFPLTPARTLVAQNVAVPVSVSASVNGRPVNGHATTPSRTAPDPSTVLLPTNPVSEPVSVGEPESWPLNEGDVLTITHTGDGSGSEQPREDDDEERDERGRPNEQDNRRAEDWIRRQCRGQNGVGRRPTWSEVGDRYGFSSGWGGRRVRAVQDRMTAQGYTFTDDGTVLAPSKSITPEPDSGEREAPAEETAKTQLLEDLGLPIDDPAPYSQGPASADN